MTTRAQWSRWRGSQWSDGGGNHLDYSGLRNALEVRKGRRWVWSCKKLIKEWIALRFETLSLWSVFRIVKYTRLILKLESMNFGQDQPLWWALTLLSSQICQPTTATIWDGLQLGTWAKYSFSTLILHLPQHSMAPHQEEASILRSLQEWYKLQEDLGSTNFVLIWFF